MTQIEIDWKDLNFLLKSGLSENICSFIRSNYNREYNTIFLNLEPPIIEAILDFLSEELIKIGMSKNDEPNEFGILIENLIDKFSREFYK